MAKRRAATELNRDNWDKEEEPEDPGTFQVATPEGLRNRIIRKAKRSLGNAQSSGTGVSPFAAFGGFAKSAGSTSTNPFTFLKNDVEAGSDLVSSSISKVDKKENGDAKTNEEKISQKKEEPETKSSTDSVKSHKQKPTRSIEYYRQLQSLNESVMKWMQLHLAKNSCCDFTPVFNDYKKHLDTLNVTYPVNSEESCEVKSTGSISTDEDSFPRSSDNNVNHGMKLSKSRKTEDETDYGAHFKSNTTNTSTICFGMARTPTATSSLSTGPTTSLKDDTAPEKKSFQFSFGLKSTNFSNSEDSMSKPFSFASAPIERPANAESADKEESEYVPPKNDFVAVKEEDAFYSKRCKLFFKKEDTYVERGIGTLHLKPMDGKTQLVIRADTSLGNILLNIVLSDSLPMSRTGKNNVLLVCVPNPPLDAKKADSKEAIPMLIRVKTSDDADKLLETLNKHKS